MRTAWSDPPRAPQGSGAATPTSPTVSASATQSGTASLEEAGCAACQSALDSCRKSSWDIALKAIREDAQERAEQLRQDGGAAPRVDDTFDDRRRALCRLSEDFLRHVWKADRDNLMGLIQEFGTEAWSENWSDYKSESLREMFDLTEPQAKSLQSGYDSLWRQHGPRLQKLLAADRTDHGALLRAAQEYFRAEDQLIGSVLGSQTQGQYGDSEMPLRTLVLAILGTFADKPWGDALAW